MDRFLVYLNIRNHSYSPVVGKNYSRRFGSRIDRNYSHFKAVDIAKLITLEMNFNQDHLQIESTLVLLFCNFSFFNVIYIVNSSFFWLALNLRHDFWLQLDMLWIILSLFDHVTVDCNHTSTLVGLHPYSTVMCHKYSWYLDFAIWIRGVRIG